MFTPMTPSETSASSGRPTITRSTPSTKITLLMNVKTFSRTIWAYVRPVAGGAVFPRPAARRDAASASVRPVDGVAATIASPSAAEPGAATTTGVVTAPRGEPAAASSDATAAAFGRSSDPAGPAGVAGVVGSLRGDAARTRGAYGRASSAGTAGGGA